MEIIIAILLGIIQGITEWLPVSSSGHLVIVQSLFHVAQPVSFDLALHLGSLLVVFVFFWKDIWNLIKGVFTGNKDALRLLGYLILATIPIALIGYFLQKWVESAFTSLLVVGFGLLFTSFLLYLSRYPAKKEKSLTAKSAFIVGLFQGIAILPGVSRSGSTISSGMFQGIKREEAARFSFLMFIPAILGATVLEIHKFTTDLQLVPTLVGVLFSIGVGFLSLKLLMMIIKKGKFHWFSLYCLIMGLITIGLYFIL